jgi:saxitoxin biosynthesis operon SxtJ-like protein
VTLPEIFGAVAGWFAARPPVTKGLLIFATTVVLIELAFRRVAPRSAAYRRWTAFFEGIGAVWAAVILGIIYFLSVSLTSLGLKLAGKDPLDRTLQPEPSFWRTHVPNPLGPAAAARHQF